MIYDTAVIGAGPAGCAFANRYAQSGKKILVIDGQDAAHPKPCGGLLSPDAQKILKKLKIQIPDGLLVKPQLDSVRVIDLGAQSTLSYRRNYINMDRYGFDKYLASLLPESVNKIRGKCVRIVKNNNIFELKIRCADGISTCFCRRLVGADGADSIVRKTFFANTQMKHYTAIQEWYKAEHKKRFYACVFDSQINSGCSWLMFKNDRLIFGGCFDQKNCRKTFENQKKRLEKYLKMHFDTPEKREACLVAKPTKITNFVNGSDRVYLVGEAAGFISASSFEGISSALTSGDHLALSLLENPDNDQAALRAYKLRTAALKIKLFSKIAKQKILFSPTARRMIMKSKICSLNDKNAY